MNYIFTLLLLFFSGWAWISSEADTPATPLRTLADRHNQLIGTCIGARPLQSDPAYVETVAREFNILVAENDMKWHRMQPEKDRFTFEAADAIVAFAEKNRMKMRGHTLVWHQAVPRWLKDTEWTKEELLGVLHKHIQTVSSHYRGKIHAWDVVNEAIEHDGQWRKKSFWYENLGEEYLHHAFQWAKEADPEALLFYNDYNAEGINAKSDAIYNLVKTMKDKGVPLDGVGFQLHVEAGKYPRIEEMRKNIRRLGELGLQVHFTEIDARIQLPADEGKLEQQAQCYRELLELCLSEPNCTAFLSWGFTDKYSWVYRQFPGFGDALIFDKEFQPKPAYFALQNVLSRDK